MDDPGPPDDAPILMADTALMPAAAAPLVLLDGVGLVVAEIAATRGYVEAARASGTRRAYASDWRRFSAWFLACALEIWSRDPGTANPRFPGLGWKGTPNNSTTRDNPAYRAWWN